MKRFDSLDTIRDEIWRSLLESFESKEHTFRFPVIATVSNGEPRQRIVVLRNVYISSRTLLFHTDKRSQKVADIQRNPVVSWLFYDSRNRIQVRFESKAQIHDPESELHEDEWNATSVAERRIHAVKHAPGTPVSDPDEVWPEEIHHPSQKLQDIAVGKPNFRVITAEVSFIDWLQLHPEGEFRALFNWDGDSWKGTWACP